MSNSSCTDADRLGVFPFLSVQSKRVGRKTNIVTIQDEGMEK
jgi:hypothetical protein